MAGRTELVGLPDGGPTSLALVKTQLAIADARDDTKLQPIVDAVNRLVRCWPVCEPAVSATDWEDFQDVVTGASMLASRLFRRRNSPAGVESFGAQGAAYVMRNDPDIAMLLRLGPWAAPVVG